jgi:SAM-dependent methyltransferase
MRQETAEAPAGGFFDDPEVRRYLTPEAWARSERLRAADRIPRDQFERLYAERFASGRPLIIGQAEYGPQHKERFWELFNAAALLLERKHRPRLLELGTSELSALFKPLLPGLELHLSDRPTAPDYIGFTEAVARRITDCDAYFAVDLEGGAAALRASGLLPGSYDLVVFAEVLEHLDVNPVEILSALLALLREDGHLYLTTPNFFRRENLEKIRRRENPQAVFPPGDGNWDRHHHHREYAAKELLRFVAEAGGQTTAFYFSACWDGADALAEEERANLVLVAARGRPYALR